VNSQGPHSEVRSGSANTADCSQMLRGKRCGDGLHRPVAFAAAVVEVDIGLVDPAPWILLDDPIEDCCVTACRCFWPGVLCNHRHLEKPFAALVGVKSVVNGVMMAT
jgi:hypothetical protein